MGYAVQREGVSEGVRAGASGRVRVGEGAGVRGAGSGERPA